MTAETLARLYQPCDHAPVYRKGCVSCSVRYVKMLRSPDHKLSRQLQEKYLSGLPEIEAKTVIEVLRMEKGK